MLAIHTSSAITPQGDGGGNGDQKVPLDMSAQGLSRKTFVPAENVETIQMILQHEFVGIDLTNLKEPLSSNQMHGVDQLSKFGALDNHTLNDILDQSRALGSRPEDRGAEGGHVALQIDHAEGQGVGASSSQADTGSADGDGSVRGGDQTPRAESLSARAPNENVQTNSGQGILGSLSAVGRAIGNAVPRATPAVLDTVCLGLSAPIAVFAIKQAIEESGNVSHDATKLFMKATLPTVVALNSLRNIIKYGTDGRRV